MERVQVLCRFEVCILCMPNAQYAQSPARRRAMPDE